MLQYPYNKLGIQNALYYIKCYFFKKYNRITVKTLPPTWTDRSEFLPHVMFQILDDFVKKEAIPGLVDWDGTPEHRAARDKMDELLDWWKNVYLKFDSYRDYDESQATPSDKRFSEEDHEGRKVWTFNLNEYDSEFARRAGQLEEEMEKELTQKLMELIKIRGHLWT